MRRPSWDVCWTCVVAMESTMPEELEANVSQATEEGIAAALESRQQERWLAENQDALESSNLFIEQHGLPLSRYRSF